MTGRAAVAATCAILLTVGAPARAQEVTLGGELSLTARHFAYDGLFAGQPGAGTSLIPEGRLAASADLGFADAELEVYARGDNRTGTAMYDVQKAYIVTGTDVMSVLVGSDIVFWGTTESFNPTNILNQDDRFARFNEPRKLGQPMVNVNFETGALGTFSFYGLFGFREQDFGDASARPRFVTVPDETQAIFQRPSDRVDFAFRNTNTVGLGAGSLDYALSYFAGTNRTPVLLPGCANLAPPVTVATCNAVNGSILNTYVGLTPGAPGSLFGQVFAAAPLGTQLYLLSGNSVGTLPYYQKVEQVGLELAYATGDWIWKFEGAHRRASNETYFSGVAGIEYRLSGAFGGPGDLTFAGEYTYDDRSVLQPITVFDDDVFASLRYDFNNRLTTSVTLAGLFDLGSGGRAYNLDISSRLSDATRVSFSATQIDSSDFSDPLTALARDDVYELTFTYFF